MIRQSFVFERRLNRIDVGYCFLNKLTYANVGMCLVAILESDVGSGVVRDLIDRATREVPRFRDRLLYSRWDVGPPIWVNDTGVSVDRHLDEKRLPNNAGWPEFMQIVNDCHSSKLVGPGPPWHLTYVRGLPDGAVAIVLALHHALSDASALTAMVSSVLIRETLEEAGIEVCSSATPNEPQSLRVAMGASLRQLKEAMDGARRTMQAVGRRRWLEHELRGIGEYMQSNTWKVSAHSAQRRSFLFRVPLSNWRAAAAARRGRINDLYLALAAACARRYFAGSGMVDKAQTGYRVVMPVNLRDADVTQDGGNVTGAGVLTLDGSLEQLADLERVALVASGARQSALGYEASLADGVVAMLPGHLQAMATFRMFASTDVMATNVIVPFAGGVDGVPANMLFMIPPVIGPPISFALTSYADWVHLAVTVDCGLVTQPERLGAAVLELLGGIVGESCVEQVGL